MKRTIHTLCGVPLMITGIAKSVSVAEQAPAFIYSFPGRIGSRAARRCVAIEINALVYDPFIQQDVIGGLGA